MSGPDLRRLFLLKPGEITLKGANRPYFESVLVRNIRVRLGPIPHRLRNAHGRLYIEAAGSESPAWALEVGEILRTTIGLNGFTRALAAEKTEAGLRASCMRAAEEALAAGLGSSFKIEARREDKSYRPDSYGIACEMGEFLRTRFPGLTVDLHRPDWILNIEVRDLIYVYTGCEPGERGLPVGSVGRGMLLLSGGIDSPVAGFLMAKRGLLVEAVHFHSYPYTSRQAREKVERLAALLARWCGHLRLDVVPFTEIQMRIRERGRPDEITLHSRAAMMRIAGHLAQRRRLHCLITGESLGQVASQTVESIGYTGAGLDRPVFRPLIGMDKEDIVAVAKRIGTYETSILRHEDCCVMFSPKHPLTRPRFTQISAAWQALGMEELLVRAVHAAERSVFGS